MEKRRRRGWEVTEVMRCDGTDRWGVGMHGKMGWNRMIGKEGDIRRGR
jgi:hypothetical protein